MGLQKKVPTRSWTYTRNHFYTKGVGKFQPRVALWQPWEYGCNFMVDATLEELRQPRNPRNATQLFQSCAESLEAVLVPGFQSKPWAGICERFQRFWVGSPTKEYSRASLADLCLACSAEA